MRKDELGPEEQRLLPGAKCQLAAADAVREAQVVADHRARSGLAPDRLRLDDEGAQSFGGAVDRGGKPRRSRPEDGEIEDLGAGPRTDAERGRDVGFGRIVQHRPIVEDHRRQPRGIDAMVPNHLPSSVRVHGIEAERHGVRCKGIAQVVAALIPLLADDAHHLVARPIGFGPGGERLLNVRIDQLLGRAVALQNP